MAGLGRLDIHSLSANEEWFKIKKEEWIKNKEGGGGEVQGNTSTFLILINSSFADWAESPVATTVTPHSVADLQFPNFTIWHPKGLNRALKYDLMKLAKKNLEVALLVNKEGDESITGLISENDTDYLRRGHHHKVIHDSSQILVRMSNPTGSFASPFCGGLLKKHLCHQVVHKRYHFKQEMGVKKKMIYIL